jgi:hypothetical protein
MSLHIIIDDAEFFVWVMGREIEHKVVTEGVFIVVEFG